MGFPDMQLYFYIVINDTCAPCMSYIMSVYQLYLDLLVLEINSYINM